MAGRTIVLACALAVAGCAEMGGYRPTVDPYNDPHADRITQDEYDCRQLARESSGGTAQQAAVGGAVGGLIGAAGGAAIGAATGNAGKGAAIGAAAGGIGGGAYKGISADEQYKRAFQNCMRNRGHNVVD
jgi:outer membrane lipoprotein SlyB